MRLRAAALRLALGGSLILAAGGCGSLVTSAASGLADDLAASIENQSDPALVREALPAYLIMLDGFAADSDSPALLGAAAELYAAYGIAFVDDADRARTLTARARQYATAALCAADRRACVSEALSFEQFESMLAELKAGSADALYSYSLGQLAYIRAHAEDFSALAALPRIEQALKRVLTLGAGENAGTANMYLGVLNTLRPPALGGQPEVGRDYFERALELTGGKDLSVKVEYARGYARLIYDRELHDRLLNEVLAAEVQQPGLTLVNSLARQQAEALLAESADFF